MSIISRINIKEHSNFEMTLSIQTQKLQAINVLSGL